MENNRYNNGKIYKLVDQENGYFYIGSTCDTLVKRLYHHKHTATRHPERKVYKYFNNYGWDNVKIILIEEHYLDNKEQLLREENKIIEMYLQDEKCLNSVRPIVSIEEKLEHQRKLNKKYYEENEEKCGLMNKKKI